MKIAKKKNNYMVFDSSDNNNLLEKNIRSNSKSIKKEMNISKYFDLGRIVYNWIQRKI